MPKPFLLAARSNHLGSRPRRCAPRQVELLRADYREIAKVLRGHCQVNRFGAYSAPWPLPKLLILR